MATIEEKQIAKEILLEMMKNRNLNLYSASDEGVQNHNIVVITDTFKKLLASVTNQD